MDTGIIFNILSIFVSIIIGLSTFFIADKRSRKNKYLNAKSKILNDLSKSLGENSIPQYEVINSVIRSVLREENENNLDVITVEEILDDLLRQILSDPFLDSKRRNELQKQIMKVEDTSKERTGDLETTFELIQELDKESKSGKEEKVVVERKSFYSNLLSFSKYSSSLSIGVLATIITTLTFQFISKESIFNIDTIIKDKFDITTVLITAIVTAILSIVIITLKFYDKKKKRR